MTASTPPGTFHSRPSQLDFVSVAEVQLGRDLWLAGRREVCLLLLLLLPSSFSPAPATNLYFVRGTNFEALEQSL